MIPVSQSPTALVNVATSVIYPQLVKRVTLFAQNRTVLIAFEDIVWLEGSGNYTFIHTRDKRRYLMAKTLKTFEQELVGAPFTRIHKSHVVNLTYVRRISFGINAYIELTTGPTLTIARRRLTPTREQYNQHQQLMMN